MNFKSFSRKEIIDAQKKGQDIYELETGTSGNDDFLIAEEETEKEILAEVLNFHELNELPTDWSLKKIDWNVEENT